MDGGLSNVNTYYNFEECQQDISLYQPQQTKSAVNTTRTSNDPPAQRHFMPNNPNTGTPLT